MRLSTPLIIFIFLTISFLNAQNPISLTNPQVGQQDRYLFFEGSEYCTAGEFDSIFYTTDTLTLTIDSLFENGALLMSEKLSPGSTTPLIEGVNGDVLMTFHLENDSSSVYFSSDLSLLLLGNFLLEPKFNKVTENATFIEGWKTGLSCSHFGHAHAIDQNILGTTYDHLNIYINDISFANDGPGFTFFFSPERGIVGHSRVNPWTMKGFGWHLLPNEISNSTLNLNAGKKSINIYPSLLSQNQTLYFEQRDNAAEKLEVRIYNQNGILVSQQQLNETQQYIDDINLPKGIYFVECIGNNHIFQTQKIIVI